MIRETEQFIAVKSINTGHCWSLFKNEYNPQHMQDILSENIAQVVRADQTDEKLAKLNAILIDKQRELAALDKEKKDYSALADELEVLRAQKQEILVEKTQTEGYKMRIQEMGALLEDDCSELTEYDESMVRRYIQGIRVYDDKFTIFFKAGIDLDIRGKN